jgi:hypothetical protein
MMKSIKRLIVTGAAVMVMMSFAAPAMAQDGMSYKSLSLGMGGSAQSVNQLGGMSSQAG